MEATISQITILPDMIDDIGQKTSTSLSDPIRQCLYAILNCSVVTEYVREIVPSCLHSRIRLPSLFEIDSVSASDKSDVLFTILHGLYCRHFSHFQGQLRATLQ